MKVLFAKYRDKNHSAYFAGNTRREFKAGNMTRGRDAEIPNLQMSFNPNTQLVTFDIPGETLVEHASALQLWVEPSIAAPEPGIVSEAGLKASHALAVSQSKPAPKGKAKASAKAPAPPPELVDRGDDLDADVERYMKKGKASPPPKTKKASSTMRVEPKAEAERDDE